LPFGGKLLAWINYLLLMIFYIGVVMTISDGNEIVYGIPGSLKALLVLPLICIGLTILMVFYSIGIFRESRILVFSRIYYAYLTLVSGAALLQLAYWNFVGFNY
jgi:hypothetical protein